MSTALELVNRMRRKRRDATSSVITDRQGIAYLDILNSAITAVLEERTWNFQTRSDGRLNLIPSYTGSLATLTPGSAAFTITAPSGISATTDLANGFVLRLIVTSDPVYGQTAFPILNVTYSAGGGGSVTGNLRAAWTGNAFVANGLWRLFAYEYVLPSIVKQVTNVIHQERPVALEFEERDYSFETLVPRPQDYIGGDPECVMVGGQVQPTYDLLGTVSVYTDAAKIFPPPDSEAALDYSYIYRQARLVAASDSLFAPYVVEDIIVELATARAISMLEKDPQIGLPLERRVMDDIRRVHANQSSQPSKHNTIKTFDQMRPRATMRWLPPTVAGLSGS